MGSLGTTVILAFIFVTVGFVGGALVAIFFGDRGGKNDPEEKAVPETAKLPPVQVATENPNEQEIALLSRDKSNGLLLLRLEGKRFDSSAGLDAKKRIELQKAAQELFLWAGGRIDKPPVETASAPVPTAPKPEAMQPVPSVEPVVQPVSAAVPVPTVPPVVAVPVAPRSMVVQIDEIFQSLLARSPYANQRVLISEDLREGVVVWVGSMRYNGIEAVPDPEIKTMIRQAVAEWERRSGGIV